MLRQYFGFSSFREGQQTLIDAVLAGRDVLGVMPTGGGKSLCYELPALLLPGIRISFMVLSPALATAYHQMKDTFAQTASKTEQIALCAYLRDGNMKSRTKKIRRLYTGKAKTLCALLAKALPDHPVRVGENGLQVQIETPMLPDSAPFEQAGLALYIVKEKSGKNIVVVSPSAVPADRLEEAAHAVAAALYKAEEAAKAKRSKDIY